MKVLVFFTICWFCVVAEDTGQPAGLMADSERHPLLDIGLPQVGVVCHNRHAWQAGWRSQYSMVVECIENAAAHSPVRPLVAFYDSHGKYGVVVFFKSGTTQTKDNDLKISNTVIPSPGMNRTTKFSEETKRSLSVVVASPSSGLFGYKETRCKLSIEGAACAAKHLNLRKGKTQVMISGYMDGSFSPLVRSFMALYLGLGRNVIVLEIFPILVRTYPIAARITKPLGDLLGEFLASLTFKGLSPRRMELVGASLGAHIASYAADTYKQLTGRRPARLTGLDPAGPCFRNVPPTARLNADAAHHVDVLHTNIDGFGIADALGHVDFYANGGEYQPAIKGDFIMPCFQLCSHVRSAFYWLLSYNNPDKFVAVQCDSVADARVGNCYEEIRTNSLGPKTNFSKPGVYYLPTNAKAPYFMGLNGLKKRKFGVNDYLITPAPDEDMTI